MMSAHTIWCSGGPECAPLEGIHATKNHDVTSLDPDREVSVWLAGTSGRPPEVSLAMGLENVRLDAEHAELLAKELAEHAAKLRQNT